MSEIIDETVEVMLRASEALRRSMLSERELLKQIEIQRAQITVARGYLMAGRADLAAMVLEGEPNAEPQPVRESSLQN